MGRRIPTSAKARKEKLQTDRAVKKARAVPTLHPLDEQLATSSASLGPAFDPLAAISASRPSGSQRLRTADEAQRDAAKEGRMKLESRFLKLPLDLLNHHRLVCATEPLVRPIPDHLGLIRVEDLQQGELEGLTCPKRPKWRYTMSKLEVERNEEGMFAKWIKTTDDLLNAYSSQAAAGPNALNRTSPSFFERNLHVWRQLWRVTETSSIILILIDCRFPLIHWPPSLEAHVKSLGKPYILVLTKTDLVPRSFAEAWKTWFEEREGPDGASVVLMTSYRETERTALTQGTQARYIPAAPTSARQALLTALRRAHAQLLTPSAQVASRPEWLAKWSPRVRREVDWDAVESEADVKAQMKEREQARHAVEVEKKKEKLQEKKKSRRNKDKDLYVPRPQKTDAPSAKEPERAPEPEDEEQEGEYQSRAQRVNLEGDDAYPFITIGLIGQPNVGKSSLLNALLGKKVVRASRTPGKTKSLQTIFWNRTIRLCDCPGLVVPSNAGMEKQVLSGVIPIQNVEPVLYYISQRMPLEWILKLRHPDQNDFSLEHDPKWTADELLAEYATDQGFITAKAGRPDLYRAGAQILRLMHTSAIPWGFRPPFAGDAANQGDQEGIYIKDFVAKASTESELRRDGREVRDGGWGSGEESGEEGSEEERLEEDDDRSEEESEEEEIATANRGAVQAVKSAFAALMVEDGEEEEEEESDE